MTGCVVIGREAGGARWGRRAASPVAVGSAVCGAGRPSGRPAQAGRTVLTGRVSRSVSSRLQPHDMPCHRRRGSPPWLIRLKFTEDHLWVRVEGSRAQIGISEYGQNEFGEVIAVEVPDVGDEIEKGEPFGEIETVRTVSGADLAAQRLRHGDQHRARGSSPHRQRGSAARGLAHRGRDGRRVRARGPDGPRRVRGVRRRRGRGLTGRSPSGACVGVEESVDHLVRA